MRRNGVNMEDRIQKTHENEEPPEMRPEQEVNNNSSEITNPIPTTATPPIPSEIPVR